MPATGEITRLLAESRKGNRAAKDELVGLFYNELRRLAGSFMRRERVDHTLQATALVNEAYLKLVGQKVSWESRAHLLGVAAQQMRRILVDYARKHEAGKRGGGGGKVDLSDSLAVTRERPQELLALDGALDRLTHEHPRQAQVVELRFFGGYTEDEAAKILGISVEVVKRDWKFAKAWLGREIRQSK